MVPQKIRETFSSQYEMCRKEKSVIMNVRFKIRKTKLQNIEKIQCRRIS